MVSSRLFPPGTIYASAVTPVIVAAVSEMLHKPVDRVTELRRQRQTMVLEAARAPYGEEAGALQGAPSFAHGAAADEELAVSGNGTGSEPPIRIHGRSRRSRLLHPKVWLVTGAVAFTIAAAALTLPELIFGGAVATKHRTTLFGGGSSSTRTKTETTETTTQTEPQTTVTETVPAQTPTTTETQTTTTETQTTPTETAPSGGTPAPGDTGTSTSPSGNAVPPTP
jgi:hypothetical protein